MTKKKFESDTPVQLNLRLETNGTMPIVAQNLMGFHYTRTAFHFDNQRKNRFGTAIQLNPRFTTERVVPIVAQNLMGFHSTETAFHPDDTERSVAIFSMPQSSVKLISFAL